MSQSWNFVSRQSEATRPDITEASSSANVTQPSVQCLWSFLSSDSCSPSSSTGKLVWTTKGMLVLGLTIQSMFHRSRMRRHPFTVSSPPNTKIIWAPPNTKIIWAPLPPLWKTIHKVQSKRYQHIGREQTGCWQPEGSISTCLQIMTPYTS